MAISVEQEMDKKPWYCGFLCFQQSTFVVSLRQHITWSVEGQLCPWHCRVSFPVKPYGVLGQFILSTAFQALQHTDIWFTPLYKPVFVHLRRRSLPRWDQQIIRLSCTDILHTWCIWTWSVLPQHKNDAYQTVFALSVGHEVKGTWFHWVFLCFEQSKSVVSPRRYITLSVEGQSCLQPRRVSSPIKPYGALSACKSDSIQEMPCWLS